MIRTKLNLCCSFEKYKRICTAALRRLKEVQKELAEVEEYGFADKDNATSLSYILVLVHTD